MFLWHVWFLVACTFPAFSYISIVLCSYSLCVLVVLWELMECIQTITTFLIPFKECFRHYIDQWKMGTKNLMNEQMKLFTYLKIYIMYNLLRNSFLFLMGSYYRKMLIGCKLQFVLCFYNRIILSSFEHFFLVHSLKSINLSLLCVFGRLFNV